MAGEYVAPIDSGKHPAILVFGGSDGGLPLYTKSLAQDLAAHGYPALAIGYFGLPELPRILSGIRLEYFVRAVRWLGRLTSLPDMSIDEQARERAWPHVLPFLEEAS